MAEKIQLLSAQQRLPQHEYERRILRRRAIHLANKQQTEKQTEDEMFLHILLGKNEHYGIPYCYLDEILRPRPITPIPNTTNVVVGTIPYRGNLIAVLDPSKLLDISEPEENILFSTYWLVVVSTNQLKVALLVSEVHGNFHYRNEELSPSLDTSLQSASSTIQGIYEGKIAILDLSALLSARSLKMEKKI